MFESIFSEKEIKERFLELKKIDEGIYECFLDKIEFNKVQRFKTIAKEAVRRYVAQGVHKYRKQKSQKELINAINQSSNKKTILYVAIEPSFNLVSASVALRKNGFKTILLARNPWMMYIMEKYFDMVYLYDSFYEVAYILKETKPYLVHVQGGINCYFLGILAKFLSKSKVIMGLYDIPAYGWTKDQWNALRGGINANLDFFTEKFAFERLDGIVVSVHSIEAGEKLKYLYHSNVPMIDFPAYVCDEFNISDDEKLSYSTGNIHLVYGGFVAPSYLPKNLFGDVQFNGLIEKLTNQRIYFTIYPSPYLCPLKSRIKNLYSEYINLSKENPFFKYELKVPFDVEMRRAAKYDFGAMIYEFKPGCYGIEHTRMVIPTKFFKYLEAGLPILISEEAEYVAKLVKDYEIGIVVSQKDLDNLNEIINSYDQEKLRANVKKARKELSINKHIGRLIEFYEQVVENK